MKNPAEPYETPCNLGDTTIKLFWSMYNLDPRHWEEVIDYTDDTILQRLATFAEHLALVATNIAIYTDRRAYYDEGHHDAMTDATEADGKLLKILGYE